MDIFKDAVEDSAAKITKSFEKILIEVIILFIARFFQKLHPNNKRLFWILRNQLHVYGVISSFYLLGIEEDHRQVQFPCDTLRTG